MRAISIPVAILVSLFATPVLADASAPHPAETYYPWHEKCKARIVAAGGEKIKPAFSDEKPFQCKFTISDDGSPDMLSTIASSGDVDADKEALEVIRHAAPYPHSGVPEVKTVGVLFGSKIKVFHYY